MTEIWNLNALCRCCHTDDGELRSLQAPYVRDGAIEIYAVLLRDTFGLHINPPPIEASYSICKSCIEFLHLAYNFKKQVQECEKKFYEYCENEQTIDTSFDVKIEVDNDTVTINPLVVDDDGIDDDCDDDDDSDGGYSQVSGEVEGARKTSAQEGNSTTYHCPFCNQLFGSESSKRRHLYQVHVEDGLSCKLCKTTFNDRESLGRHFRSSHRWMIQCTFCVEVFSSRKERNDHEYNQHLKLTGYVCDHCQKSFKYRATLKRHLKSHTSQPDSLSKQFICQICGYAFTQQWGLKVHTESVHENRRPFQCCQCGKAYKCKKSLKLHMYSHTGEVPFQCQTCGKGFTTKTNLRYHMEREDHGVDGQDESVGWNLGNDEDDDEKADDSDGGYENNDLEYESEAQIDKEKKIEEEKKPNKKTKPAAEPPVGDIKTEDSVFEAEDRVHDSPDGDDYTYDDLSGEFQTESTELKDDQSSKVKTKSKTADKAKRKRVKRKHIMINSFAYKWSCDFCQEQFTSNKELLGHYSERHVPKDYSCTLCQLSFNDRTRLKKHLAKKHQTRAYCCQYCIETFKDRRVLQKHQTSHTKNGFTCDCCQKQYKRKNALFRHLKVQSGDYKRHPCETCGRAFQSSTLLKMHIRVVHDKIRPFKCDLCVKTFSLKKHLVNHRRSHTGERPFVCDICSKAFATKCSMKAHRLIHGISSTSKRFPPRKTTEGIENTGVVQCEICGKHVIKYRVRLHMNTHLKPFTCDLCSQTFGTKLQLKRHLRRHGKNPQGAVVGRHTCHLCKKSYYNWDIHKRKHDKKPFNCHLCGKIYPKQVTLDKHLEVKHYKARNYSCDVCHKTFTRPESVKVHKFRKHNSEQLKIKKDSKNKRKVAAVPVVKVEKININFDSVLPAYMIHRTGSAND